MSSPVQCAICDRTIDPYGRDGTFCNECASAQTKHEKAVNKELALLASRIHARFAGNGGNAYPTSRGVA